jgi:hypothetical protein
VQYRRKLIHHLTTLYHVHLQKPASFKPEYSDLERFRIFCAPQTPDLEVKKKAECLLNRLSAAQELNIR